MNVLYDPIHLPVKLFMKIFECCFFHSVEFFKANNYKVKKVLA